MDRNKAPEKIYVNFPFGERHPERGPMVTEQGLNAEDIEYIRTDAFIEKACEWIKTNMDDYIHVVYDTVTGMPTDDAYIADKIVVEDFSKYMKGE